MKLLNLLPSSAGRAIHPRPPTDAAHYGGNLTRALQERYGFLEVPTRVSHYDYAQGVKFLQGLFSGHLVDLEVFENGVRAVSPGGTEICDLFIDDLLKAAQERGIGFEDAQQQRIYTSAAEIEFLGDFNALFATVGKIGTLIGLKLAGYGGPADAYRGIGISMIGHLSGAGPDQFKLEHRANTDFDSTVFYSIAPLALSDHITVLEELERLTS